MCECRQQLDVLLAGIQAASEAQKHKAGKVEGKYMGLWLLPHTTVNARGHIREEGEREP